MEYRSSASGFHKFLEAFACAHVSDGFMEGDGERMLGCFINLQGSPLFEVKELKDKGNGLFRQNHFDRAAACYDEACKLLGLSIGIIGGDDIHSVCDLAVSLNSNLAACALKLEEFQAALDLCSMILNTFPRNVKALFRRAIAFTKLKRFSEAELDLLETLAVEPKNKDVIRELDVVKGHLLMKENGKRVLEVAHMVDVDRNFKRHIQVSESYMNSNDLESVSEVTKEHNNRGVESDIGKKDNERVNIEVTNDLSVCVTDLGTSLKNEQVSIKSIFEFSKNGGGDSRLRIPGQAYQKLLEGKESSFYHKKNLSVITIRIRILNVETIKKGGTGGTKREICEKKKRRRRCPRKGKSKNTVVIEEEMPPLDIINMSPVVSCTGSSASSSGDNFISPDTQIIQVIPAHDSSLASSLVSDNATLFCPKPQYGSNDHHPSLLSTPPIDHQPFLFSSFVEKCLFSFSFESFRVGPSTPLFSRNRLNHQMKEKKKKRTITLTKDYSKGDESPRQNLSTCSSSGSLYHKFLRLRGVSVSCCRYSSEAQLIKKRKEMFTHLTNSDRPLKKPALFITPIPSLVSYSNNVIIKSDSESRVSTI